MDGDAGISIERRVYGALRFALLTGTILPGQALTSRSLSGALNVSISPVRDALKRLEADGALTSRNKSAFFVNDPDQADFAQILEIRLNLEGLAIRAAAQNASEKDLVLLRKINGEHERLLLKDGNGRSRSLVPNFRFHFEMYKLSRSNILVDMIETLWLRIGPTLHHYFRNDQAPRSVATFHNDMLEALARHDPQAAVEALHHDLRAAFDAVVPQLRSATSDDGPVPAQAAAVSDEAGPSGS